MGMSFESSLEWRKSELTRTLVWDRIYNFSLILVFKMITDTFGEMWKKLQILKHFKRWPFCRCQMYWTCSLERYGINLDERWQASWSQATRRFQPIADGARCDRLQTKPAFVCQMPSSKIMQSFWSGNYCMRHSTKTKTQHQSRIMLEKKVISFGCFVSEIKNFQTS